ncbi:11936_t:CDS:2, partial [Ambispora gerdemannii]
TSAIFRGILSHATEIYGLLLDRMDRLVDTGYFDVNSDIMNGFDERRGNIQEKMEVSTLLGRRAKHEKRRSSKTRITSTELIDEIEEYDHEDDVPPPYTASPTNYTSRGVNNNN